MQIANPIYDVVFKYLLEDSKIAKLIISTIMEEEVLSLEFLPQESIQELKQRSLTVYRLDFSAKIKTPDGQKQVIIEIQKAKFATDIMRFRRYLGEQYKKEENICKKLIEGREKKQAIPIFSIYLLGHKLEHTEAPIIRVKRHYIDVITGKEILKKEAFIESLTHDSVVIQIPKLRKKYQTDIEYLLSVFDQSNRSDDQHILNIREQDYPEKYRDLIRRLQRAIAEPDVRQTMDLEDEVLEELQDLERAVEERDKALVEKNKVLEEKDRVLEEKDRVLEEKDRVLEEKDRIIENLKKKLSSRDN